MGLTKRQEEMINEIVIEESRAFHSSQQERHRILEGIDAEDELLDETPRKVELSTALQHAIIDLIEAFHSDNQLYEGVEVDDGRAAKLASHYLCRLIENDVRETADMLQSGEFDEMDEDDILPMHPRNTGKAGGVTGGTGHVDVGGPEKHAPTGREPQRGYHASGDEDAVLPPMHPRGRH